MTALALVISQDGRLIAHAVVCPEARFAGVLRTGATRIDRRFGDVKTWQAVDRDVADHLPAGRLAADSPIVRLLVEERSRTAVSVQCLTASTLEVAPAAVAPTLDAQLRGLSATPVLEQRQVMK